ncbi:MAG: hypothetical protein K9L66_10425 [Spirochaetaceae bacterium]|nr:hypothetical protein [Spirochaetaceae bacterium]MCF7948724.1 hypothetical protein [Spirochaetia bacterium]MCF7951942.1 hypothetical protein [Spirochaetaceae bacterium]
MRKSLICALLAGALVLLWTGCASQPDTSEKVSETKQEAMPAEAEETAEATEPEMEKVVEEVQLVTKRTTYYSDGVLASYRVYSYADEGTEKREEILYNSDDEAEERIVYTYEDGNLTESRHYNGNNELRRIHQFSYNDEGLLSEDLLLNAKEEQQTRQAYEYNSAGHKRKWLVYNSNDTLMSYSLYEYQDGLNTRIENYSAGNDLLDYFVIEYTPAGKPEKRVWYNSSDQREQSRVYEYENKALVNETILRANGSVKRKIVYVNNSFGNPVEVVYMDAGGDIQEQVTYDYITRSKVSYKVVE